MSFRNSPVVETKLRVKELSEGELTDGDELGYVSVLKGKLLESEELGLQTANNTKAQFANSPLRAELLNAVMDALAAHSTMSKQAFEVGAGARGAEGRAAWAGAALRVAAGEGGERGFALTGRWAAIAPSLATGASSLAQLPQFVWI